MKVKKFFGIVLAVACMAAAVSGCNLNSYFEPDVDPLDKVYVFDEDEITVRRLFEGSDEVIRYAKYLKAAGNYEYTFDTNQDNTVSNTTIDANGPIEYECFRDENGNYSSILSGGVNYSESFKAARYKSGDYNKHEYAKYYYYKTFDTTYVKDLFVYYGAEDICGSIDMEKILLPDIESLDIKQVYYMEDFGLYCITVIGNPSPIRSAIDGNIQGADVIEEITYEFDCKTHELVTVDLSGIECKKKEDSKGDTIYTDWQDFSICFEIEDISNKETQLPEMPQVVSNNGYINDIVLNDFEISEKEEIINPFDVENEFYSVAANVWSDVLATPEKDRNTVKELKTAIAAAASAYDMEVVDCEYSVLRKDSYSSDDFEGVLIRYAISGQEDVEGYIVVPIICESNNIYFSSPMAFDKKDFGVFYTSGEMDLYHDLSPSCQLIARYELSSKGTLDRQYSELKETRVSNLADQADLMYFPEENWESLKRMATDLEAARVVPISYYSVRTANSSEIGSFAYFSDQNINENPTYSYEPYYVLDVDLTKEAIEGIGETFSLNLVSKEHMDKVLNRKKNTREQNDVKWVQILDE